MACWASVVLPLLRQLVDGMKGRVPKKFHVVEDTVLLAPGVFYHHVSQATDRTQAGLWGYGKYELGALNGHPSWFGSKGLSVEPSWCEAMQVVLENTRSAQLKHFDLWLKDRRRSGAKPSVDLLPPLAGYGHRQSLTNRRETVFGGAWVPSRPELDDRFDMDSYVLDNTAPLVKNWVRACQDQNPKVSRGEVVPCVLDLPRAPAGAYQAFGMYAVKAFDNSIPEVNLESLCELSVEVALNPAIFRHPAQSRLTHSDAVDDVEQHWEMKAFCDGPGRMLLDFPPNLRRDAVFLGGLRCAYSRPRSSFLSTSPLPSRLFAFTEKAAVHGLHAEAVSIACLLEKDAISFNWDVAAHGVGVEAREEESLAVVSQVLKNVRAFCRRVKEKAKSQSQSFADFRVHERRLHGAADMFFKIQGHSFAAATTSEMSLKEQTGYLAHCLASTQPELVAHCVGGNWYSSGLRVRGKGAPAAATERRVPAPLEASSWEWCGMPALSNREIAQPLPSCLLLGATTSQWGNKSDLRQPVVRSAFHVHLQPYRCWTACIVGDSSIIEVAVAALRQFTIIDSSETFWSYHVELKPESESPLRGTCIGFIFAFEDGGVPTAS
eukprot:9484351-Pyramimonas_sp.AAC.1